MNPKTKPSAAALRAASKIAKLDECDITKLGPAIIDAEFKELVESAREAAEEIRGMRDYLRQQGGERRLDKGWSAVLDPLDAALSRTEGGE